MLDRAREHIYAARLDIAIVLSLTALAAVLRLWDIGSVPLGLHGDEAWTGIDARRVLREGWIGPYVISALGQPTGPLYFTALLFKFFPETTTTIRVSMALFGIATIPLAYLAFREMFDRTVALLAALLLCVMTWHLQLTRTGFMIGSWPFMEMLVLWALFAGLRRRSVPLLALAGVLTGLGVYSYNAYPLFVPVVAAALLWEIARTRTRRERMALVAGGGALAIAAIVVVLPMLSYIHDHGETYRLHQRVVGVTNSAAWKDAGAGAKADILADRLHEWGAALARGDRPDQGDGLAAPGHPVVGATIIALALVGLAMAVWRWRRTAHAAVLVAVLLLPFGALLSVGDGLFRRSFGLAPFIAVLAAMPLAWMLERANVRGEAVRLIGYAAVCGIIGGVGAVNVYRYFGPNQDTAVMRITYPYQEDAASHYIASLPPRTFVYFYSDWWSFYYETRRFIAPDAVGADRSHEFGNAPADQPLEFGADRTRNVAYVFLGAYINDAAEAQDLYPGGRASEGRRGSEVTFRAYFLPASEDAAPITPPT
jgi:4-amino-4-deoxy-L-arabinose transferase-like glycosyltransferase